MWRTRKNGTGAKLIFYKEPGFCMMTQAKGEILNEKNRTGIPCKHWITGRQPK